MKAVILAAGKGTRMRELTNELPKPMLKVHGKPILQHIIEGLISADIREFFIVTGFRADVTKGGLNFFDRDFCLVKLVEKPNAAQIEELRREGWLKSGDVAWYNAGIYIFKPMLFDFTAKLKKSPRGEYELTDAIIAMLN